MSDIMHTLITKRTGKYYPVGNFFILTTVASSIT